MKEEVADKVFKEKGIKQVSQFKKIWYSMTKFEKYPEMAAEGVGRAIGYLALLMLIFTIILGACLVINMTVSLNKSVDYLNEEISEVNYKDGILSIELVGEENEFISDDGIVIVDTSDVAEDKVTEYRDKAKASDYGIIWLQDCALIEIDGEEEVIYYEEVLSEFDINEFDKAKLLDLITDILSSPRTYILYFCLIVIYYFIAYFISSLLNVILLSIFGLLTALIAKMQMRYRAIFNMSIYAITLSTILQLIYMVTSLFTDFEIKYFDIMYSAISYICLTAAIFMIKSDVIKQQIEMIKMAEKKKEKIPEKADEEKQDKKDEEKQEEKVDKQDSDEKKTKNERQEEKREEEESKEKSNQKEKKGTIDNGRIEGEGSNA